MQRRLIGLGLVAVGTITSGILAATVYAADPVIIRLPDEVRVIATPSKVPAQPNVEAGRIIESIAMTGRMIGFEVNRDGDLIGFTMAPEANATGTFSNVSKVRFGPDGRLRQIEFAADPGPDPVPDCTVRAQLEPNGTHYTCVAHNCATPCDLYYKVFDDGSFDISCNCND